MSGGAPIRNATHARAAWRFFCLADVIPLLVGMLPLLAAAVALVGGHKATLHHAQVCFGNSSACTLFDELRAPLPYVSWQSALPNTALKGDIRRNCVQCDREALSRSDRHPREVWDLTKAVSRLREVSTEALYFIANASVKLGWVPPLIPSQVVESGKGSWRTYKPKARLAVILPCSSTRGEDAAILRSFFTDRNTGQPLVGGTFLEIGGANGLEQSNSWIFEVCLGWKGVLAEAHPRFYSQLLRNRPASLNLRFAACDPNAGTGWANFSAERWTGAKIITRAEQQAAEGGSLSRKKLKMLQTLSVQCGQLGSFLSRLDVRRLDFLSVDVEGAELTVLKSLDFTRLSIGVVLVEVRGDGVRAGVFKHMIKSGLRYVGQFQGIGTKANEIIDDVYCNFTHLSTYFPTSHAAAALTTFRRSRNVLTGNTRES